MSRHVHAVSGVAGTSASLSIGTSTGLWANWVRIAVRNEAAARRARETLVEARTTGESGEPNDELEAAMVAITAAAFAIDGFCGSIAVHVPVPLATRRAWKRNRTRQPGQIAETLKLGFRFGRDTQRLPADLKHLFGLRGGGVHFREVFRQSVPHPILGNVPHERVAYSLENATHAVEIMLGVLTRAVERPRAELPEVVDFAQRWRPILDGIRAERTG